MKMRVERDTLGEVLVPEDRLWGAQTQRSFMNFKIGIEKMPLELIYAYAHVKKAAAIVNGAANQLPDLKVQAIVHAADKVLNEELDDHFPLVVWQTGSGTQTNMNMNEVLATVANEWLKKEGSDLVVHPNDDVNRSQSSNDTFPTAMHIATIFTATKQLLPALATCKATLAKKAADFKDIVKIGRTHMQDATPLSLGQEISGWMMMVKKSEAMILESLKHVRTLAIGGTAVGTGINASADFGEKVVDQLSLQLHTSFLTSTNYFHALTSHDELVYFHGSLKALATDFFKIANDVRLLASGPRSGIGELTIPSNEPGSSIMPGKVNPTQSEALTMVATQVFGNDATIGFAASQGHFQLNVFKPVIIYNVLQSIRLLADGIKSFHDHCLIGLSANEDVIKEHVERSLMLVTALNPHIGYERSAEIAKLAFATNLTLKEAALKLGYLTAEEFDHFIQPGLMIHAKKE
ncbi:class II fumarate hydratase [Halalkalibacter nanhaiisediminis]|uniref:Fumarate hydratase class II n=1 Tax=Halalkalibacter nanhaiisediminis TaxID=688079 RepID=A0A562QNR7_9BACI|nr:class II fumarate hydratase [Halalkalibacter nanhaiisediminis]TWI57840.1 fumarase class II [Halalkalibacter nanhaiisediminis]